MEGKKSKGKVAAIQYFASYIRLYQASIMFDQSSMPLNVDSTILSVTCICNSSTSNAYVSSELDMVSL